MDVGDDDEEEEEQDVGDVVSVVIAFVDNAISALKLGGSSGPYTGAFAEPFTACDLPPLLLLLLLLLLSLVLYDNDEGLLRSGCCCCWSLELWTVRLLLLLLLLLLVERVAFIFPAAEHDVDDEEEVVADALPLFCVFCANGGHSSSYNIIYAFVLNTA